MSQLGNDTHICEEHLGARCRCTVCGKSCHDYYSDDDGTFAASGKVETVRCTRCGDEHHYYSDTGTELKNYHVLKHEPEPEPEPEPVRKPEPARTPEPVHPPMQSAHGELIYMVQKLDENVVISGITERSIAEKLGLRHLTVIIVPFVADGAHEGHWITHNRHDKQIVKGKACAPLSLNLFGGHCGPSDDITGLVGQTVKDELLFENALRELSEELLVQEGLEKRLERWGGGVFTGEYLNASPYEVCEEDLIPIGFTEYTAKDNVEYSYVFALPVPGSQVEQLIAADNYMKISQADGTAREADIALPVEVKEEAELKRLWESRDPQIEVCDAITRLWEDQNREVYQKLLDSIRTYIMARNKYDAHVAQSVSDGFYLEAVDVFTCGLGLYAVMCLAGHTSDYYGVCLMEIINLDGRKLSEELKESGITDCLDDYCFIASSDLVAESKAQKRRSEKKVTANGLADVDVEKDARTLDEIEQALGCSILEHPEERKSLFVHKWCTIEIKKRN